MSHKTTIEAVNRAFSEGKVEDFLSLCTPDVCWTMAGMGTWEGIDTIREEWNCMMGTNTNSLPRISVRKLIADESSGMADGIVETARKDGSTHRMHYCDVYSFRDGKVSELISYCIDVKPVVSEKQNAGEPVEAVA